MVIQKSNLKTLYLDKRSQLKFILFTVIIGSIFYYDETFALDEIDNKSSLNSSSLQIPSENKTLESELVFSNVTNITNNPTDSVYAQIVANDNNVYMIWQESVTQNSNEKNYDIFFKKSDDNGNTFSKPINLSNNAGFSEHPQIAVSNNGIFIVWADNTNSNNTDVMFTKSEDNGTTFSKIINLSNNSQNSNNQEISAFDENVYVVWHDIDSNNFYGNEKNEVEKKPLSSIMFKASLDTGKTFKDSIELANNTNDAYPKVNSYKEHVYVTWNSENSSTSTSKNDDENSGLFFIKSSDKGNNFENSIRIAHYNFGESQIAVNENKVFIVWGGLHAKNINDIYFVQSDDNGTAFTDPYIISEKDTSAENRNDTDKINSPSNVEIPTNNPAYIAWQDEISRENQDIFFITNIKNDIKYSKILNLSNNSGISECPSIAISNNYIYIVWEDITPGNHEILFIKGTIPEIIS
ncbi:MAG: sialidase family protein [Deltaproteobacteria bacterium]|nr:sialidase family protein [Nitrososphaeraceae archaeon]